MSYLGRKGSSGTPQAIISQFPPHDVYIEMFGGSGAIMSMKPRAARQIAVDLSDEAVSMLKALECCEVYQEDAFAFVCGFNYARSGRVLIYADPPYPDETRTSRHVYEHELKDEEHDELLDLLKSLPDNVDVIISTYPNAKYDEALRSWRKIEFQAMTRGGPRTEVLYMNFDEGAVQWHKFAGKDFTDRQRILRKCQRQAKNFASLPYGERLAILSALLQTFEKNNEV